MGNILQCEELNQVCKKYNNLDHNHRPHVIIIFVRILIKILARI
jgi:hypothetical protein